MDQAVRMRGMASSERTWSPRLIVAAVLLCLAGAIALGVFLIMRKPVAPKHQTAHITLLPDQPPPPPPPPEQKKDPPPQQKEQAAPQPVVTPKQEPPPEPAQLKMEGQAGDGPSAFASGDVKQDFIGGEVGNGSRFSAYVARLEQRLQNELTRRKLKVGNARVFLWIGADGAVQRYSIQGVDAGEERTLRSALAEFTRVDEAPLPDMPMPVGLQIN